MKAVSIKEPFASLIKNGVKCIETRSWKTNYRGKILIHSSKTHQSIRDNIKHLVDFDLTYGCILCEAELVDCIYMTEEFIEKLKKENYTEYLCGRYEVGRYAWVLKNIKPIKPIPTKGQLGIWNYNDKIDI
jgi:hypothetical protein